MDNKDNQYSILIGGKERDFNSLPYSIDGMSIWKELSKNKDSPRNLMLHNVSIKSQILSMYVKSPLENVNVRMDNDIFVSF